MSHYHINMAAMIQLGKWFDYLRENNVYDNTRIILVSDHSWPLFSMEDTILNSDNKIVFNDDSKLLNIELYCPLLMVKDFNSQELVTSSEFMTIADVPTLAMENLIENPKNPYTGKAISSAEKTAHEQFVLLTWANGDNSGATFQPGYWASVKDKVLDKNSWTIYDGEMVLSENKAD